MLLQQLPQQSRGKIRSAGELQVPTSDNAPSMCREVQRGVQNTLRDVLGENPHYKSAAYLQRVANSCNEIST
tara:strand:- start:470 stop:685 length:216 start_codon:yes stop_codon:yes gene_type:complete